MNRESKKNLVMAVTVGRIPLVMVFAALAIVSAITGRVGLGLPALILLVLSAVTDLFDGMLARKFDVCTRLGAYADPLADKIVYLVALPLLVYLAAVRGQIVHSAVLLVLTFLFLLRDQWVSFMRSLAAEHGGDVRANWAGKLRTAVSFPIICLVYIYLQWFTTLPVAIAYACEAVGIAVNLISIYIYTRDYWKYIKLSAA